MKIKKANEELNFQLMLALINLSSPIQCAGVVFAHNNTNDTSYWCQDDTLVLVLVWRSTSALNACFELEAALWMHNNLAIGTIPNNIVYK